MSYHLISSLEGIPLSDVIGPYARHEVERLSIRGLWPTIPTNSGNIQHLETYQRECSTPLVLPLRLAKYARSQDFLTAHERYPKESEIPSSNFQTRSEGYEVPFMVSLILPTDLLQTESVITASGKTPWVIAPLCVMPTVKAILSIHRWDSYLAAHYLKQLLPILDDLTPALCQEIWQHKQEARPTTGLNSLSPLAHAYIRLERKLDRQYETH